MRLIYAELTQRSVSAQMVQTLHGGNKEAEEMMRYYNPSSFLEGVSFGMELASKIIHNAPTVEAKPEWIPVTELDLDHNQEALIKLDDGFVCSARFLISDSGNNCGFYHKHIGFLQCPQVVAWMPYNAERGGKNE